MATKFSQRLWRQKHILYFYIFAFYYTLMLELNQKFIFQIKNAKFFLKRRFRCYNFGRFVPKFCPHPKLMGGARGLTWIWPLLVGGGCPLPRPPNLASLGRPSFQSWPNTGFLPVLDKICSTFRAVPILGVPHPRRKRGSIPYPREKCQNISCLAKK